MSILSEQLDRLFPRRRAMSRLTRLASIERHVPVSIDRQSIDLGEYRMIIRKDGPGVGIACNIALYSGRTRRLPAVNRSAFNRRPAAIIHVFMGTNPKIRSCHADTSDGYESVAGIVSFCSQCPDAILVPDFDFYASKGYAAVRHLAAKSDVPWRERRDTVLWRGSSTGLGIVADGDMSPTNPDLIQRTRMCLILRHANGADAMLINVVQTDDRARSVERLRTAGILGARIDQSAWLGHKFAIDIDGNSNAWANLFTRLLLGCCVIKVASPPGYRQWYYDDLIAWQHYVPVRSDMSDLVEKIDWCRSNTDRCEEIAAAGRRLAMAMTFESEMARGTETLNRALRQTNRLAAGSP